VNVIFNPSAAIPLSAKYCLKIISWIVAPQAPATSYDVEFSNKNPEYPNPLYLASASFNELT